MDYSGGVCFFTLIDVEHVAVNIRTLKKINLCLGEGGIQKSTLCRLS